MLPKSYKDHTALFLNEHAGPRDDGDIGRNRITTIWSSAHVE